VSSQARTLRRILAGVGLGAVLLGPGCDPGDVDFDLEFDTAVEVEEVELRAFRWALGNGFESQGGVRQLNAEKRRPLASGNGHQIDILLVRFRREADGTHVTIRALTDLDDEHGRRRAPQVSNEARADARALASELMAARPPG
jgi:hypothetical protein